MTASAESALIGSTVVSFTMNSGLFVDHRLLSSVHLRDSPGMTKIHFEAMLGRLISWVSKRHPKST